MTKRDELLDRLCRTYRRTDVILHRYGIPEDDMEDIMQDIFITAFSGIGKLKDEEKLRPWLMGIARNKARKYWEKKGAARKRFISVDTEEGRRIFEAYQFRAMKKMKNDQSKDLEKEETDQAVYRALFSMRRSESAIFVLHGRDGYTLKEISEMTGMNYATVRTVYRRTKKRLRAMLGPYFKK